MVCALWDLALTLKPFLTVNLPDVTSTLTKLIIDGISSHSTLLDSYVVLHGAFVSALHKLVGIEFGQSTSLIPTPTPLTVDLQPPTLSKKR